MVAQSSWYIYNYTSCLVIDIFADMPACSGNNESHHRINLFFLLFWIYRKPATDLAIDFDPVSCYKISAVSAQGS